jgi:hypothetical protein
VHFHSYLKLPECNHKINKKHTKHGEFVQQSRIEAVGELAYFKGYRLSLLCAQQVSKGKAKGYGRYDGAVKKTTHYI